MSVLIYHNPKCSKSRKALELLSEKQINVRVIEYLKEGLTEEEILNLAKKIQCPVKKLIRVKEEEFKKLDLDLNDDLACAKAIAKIPKLLERPVVVFEDRAIIARPPELIFE